MLAALHSHNAGDECVRDLADASVVGADVFIEQRAVVGNLFLQLEDLIPQVEVGFAGSEAGIVFRRFEIFLQSIAELQISVRFLADARCARASIIGI